MERPIKEKYRTNFWPRAGKRIRRHRQVVIIGAGPAGLAAAGALAKAGIKNTLLERSDQAGNSWQSHYDRLHLHTVKYTSWLPHIKFPREYPKYPSKQQVVDYLQSYAEHFDINPHFNQKVVNAHHRNRRWRIETEDSIYSANSLIIATGYNAIPKLPAFPGQKNFQGEILHSSQFRTGKAFEGKRVLVVGCGNSGAEIAIDLHEQGASPSLVVRKPIHVTPRDMWGVPINLSTIALAKLPLRVSDLISKFLLWLHHGNLKRYGIHSPRGGPIRQILEQGRVPLLDIGTLNLIKSGALPIVPGVKTFHENDIEFADGRRLPFDAVILATGYKAGISEFLEGADSVTDLRGYPYDHGRQTSIFGLYFIGFRNPPEGALREMRIEALSIAREISSSALALMPAGTK